MGHTMQTILEARDVRKEYFRKGREAARYFDALATTSISLRRGELVEVTGRSGSGKTTLLSVLAGLLRPTEGTVLFEDRDLYALPERELARLRNERFGVVPQGQTPLLDLTVLQNVTLPYAMYRGDGGDERALLLLESLGIADLSESYPSELSGGEMRRMAIARALVCEPSVVFADEPTGDLDDQNTQVVLQTLRATADAGAAVLLVTHESAAQRYADRVVRMGS